MIKRSDLYSNCDCNCGDFGLQEVPDGDWVKYEDHERETKELERKLQLTEQTLAKIQALPELPWAEARASMMQCLASLSRDGYQKHAVSLLAVLDKASVYFSKLKLRADEAERRVRWLESLLGGLECSFSDFYYDRSCCVFCGSTKGQEHFVSCELFLTDGTPKPTPEDFK